MSRLKNIPLRHALSCGIARRKVLLQRWSFLAFVFSIPFEAAFAWNTSESYSGEVSRIASLSKMFGFFFFLTTLFRFRECYGRLPPKLWTFGTYVCAFLVLGAVHGSTQIPGFYARLLTLVQLMVMLVAAYNLCLNEQIRYVAVRTFGIACAAVAVLHFLGITAEAYGGLEARQTSFGSDPNNFASVLSLGALSIVGTAGRLRGRFSKLLNIGATLIICGVVVDTGSRGAEVAFVGGLLAFLVTVRFSRRSFVTLILSLAAFGATWAGISRNRLVAERWAASLNEGQLGSRPEIAMESLRLFVQRPLVGWGPLRNYQELGAALGQDRKDTHNLFLGMLTEVGVLVTSVFVVGLWRYLRIAWWSARVKENSLPLALLVCVLLVNLSLTWLTRKPFWLVLAWVGAEWVRNKQLSNGGSSERKNGVNRNTASITSENDCAVSDNFGSRRCV